MQDKQKKCWQGPWMGCRKTSLQIGQINYWLRLAKRSMEGMSFINFGSTMSLKILIVWVSGVCSSELGFLDGLPLPMVVFFFFPTSFLWGEEDASRTGQSVFFPCHKLYRAMVLAVLNALPTLDVTAVTQLGRMNMFFVLLNVYIQTRKEFAAHFWYRNLIGDPVFVKEIPTSSTAHFKHL